MGVSVWNRNQKGGFTLIELLVVMAIIGILASLVMMSLSESRAKGSDAARKTQVQELLKAIELFYGDGGVYPQDGTPADGTSGDIFSNIGSGIVGGPYLKRLPNEPEKYHYCVSSNRKSMMLAVNTEQDLGGTGSEYCNILRGPGPDYGCDYTAGEIDATDACTERFW